VVVRDTPVTNSLLTCEEIGYHPGHCARYLPYDMLMNWLISAKMCVDCFAAHELAQLA
jgi:hypothetical protein